MSESTPDDTAIAAYIAGLYEAEDELLRELRAEMERRGMPAIQVSAGEARLLQVLLAAAGARRVLEIGTLGGYSAICMARALPHDGRVVSLEIEPLHAEVAREFIRRAELGAVIEIQVGDALETLAAMEEEGSFDACFIDADKENYPAYLEHALRLVRPGGLILGDNALWSGRVAADAEDDATRAMQAFNRRLAEPDLLSTIVTIRDGLAIAVVRRGDGADTRPRGELLGLPPLDMVTP